LVQTYYKHLIVDTVSCKDEALETILDAVKKVKVLKTTKLSASILQALVLTLFLKDVKK
jgi:hypothetical protein